MMGRLEILAPAGAREQLEAAVFCGADAVYLGAGKLNARRAAGNFEGNALREAVAFCHARGVKVHLTLNTVVLQRELGEALALVQEACEWGVDALIVQDLGLVSLLRRVAPKMPLHASTQMAVHNLEGAKLLEEMGFVRVVLARELSRDEIAFITAGTTLETEVFVHGALCMCVSGQCYMSSIIGERSGNRGMCAQPCRLPFYEKQVGRCGLSLKDLTLVDRLGELAELGVTAVKIEGRMKRPEYVAAAVTACREVREGKTPEIKKLQSVFSRSGFTNGYYDGILGPELFGTRQKEDVTAAAGVLGELAELYRKETPRAALAMTFTLEEGKPATLLIHHGTGHTVRVLGAKPQPAREKPTTQELVRQSMSKLGGTPFFLEQMNAEISPGLCLPVSQMNAMRREAVDALLLQLEKPVPIPYTPPAQTLTPHAAPPHPALRARFATVEQAAACREGNWEHIILPVFQLDNITENLFNPEYLVAELPRIDFTNQERTEQALRRVYERGVRHAVAGNLGALRLARRLGFTVHADWSLNLTNGEALECCGELGCVDACVSPELNLAEIKRIPGKLPRGILAYGHLPLMVVRCCPARAERGCGNCSGIAWMKDRLGNTFTVTCGGTREVTEVLNHIPIYLADRLTELSGLDFALLYFTTETPEECAKIRNEYQAGGKREGITRGLYYRNIL